MLGGRPGGFFIPYRHAKTVVPPQHYPEIEALLRAHDDEFAAVLAQAEAYADRLAGFHGPPPAPRLSQDWFPRLDAAIAYTLVRDRKPVTIIEVGSGHSTRFMAQALADAGRGSLVAFDPAPRASLDGLPVQLHRRVLSEGDVPTTALLRASDILFIDSSHIAMPGTDVDLLVSRIIPSLARGVLLHVHDVFLPDAYPQGWRWRGYNEQIVVAALLAGGAFKVIFPCHYAATRLAPRIAAGPLGRLPLVPGAYETSIWLERC